jgi:hypothetical protein
MQEDDDIIAFFLGTGLVILAFLLLGVIRIAMRS